MHTLYKAFNVCCIALFLLASLNSFAQTSSNQQLPDIDNRHAPVPENDPVRPFTEIYRDTVHSQYTTTEIRDSVLDPMRVVTNKFGNNWFVFATGGAHTFQGDYSSTANFSGTISPDWSVGIGKWFTPGIALKLEFIRSKSEGYTEFLTGHYGYGPIKLNKDGVPYRNMSTSWWDISGMVLLNFTRLFLGYEGYNSPKRMNQFMMALGFGGVHHLGFKHSHGSDNEWSGHIELQYSRFFTRSKQFSLDLKLRGIFYQTNFDLEYGHTESVSNKWDSNLGIDVGFTWYLGQKRMLGWGSSATKIYQRDFRERDILIYRERVDTVMVQKSAPQYLTFYVFYPNNYSGRNDAPIVDGASVNAIDYLAGGIFAQKKYSDTAAASSLIGKGARTTRLAYDDIPTESATADFDIDCVQRGYEMSHSVPLSLSMQPTEMERFFANSGFYYAPIYDGQHEWHYRIDDATLGQQLISAANYFERETYGLNAHAGIPVLQDNLDFEPGEVLVSFADIYAAIHGNTGHISKYADHATVDMIKDIFKNGIVTKVKAHGVATSQDNYTGSNAQQIGLDRNNALAENRAATVVKWLAADPVFEKVPTIKSVGKGFTSGINPVSDPSTRGLNAKLNRCVKVTVEVTY